VAAQVEAVDDVEHAEEQRLTPGDLLVADADVQRAFLVVQEQGREVDEVVRSGCFERVRPLEAGHLVFEVVRVATVKRRVAAADAAGVGVGNAQRIELAVVARIEHRTQTADQLQARRELHRAFKFNAQQVQVEEVVGRRDRTGDVAAEADGRNRERRQQAAQPIDRLRHARLAIDRHAIERIAALVVWIFAAERDRQLRTNETAPAEIEVAEQAPA